MTLAPATDTIEHALKAVYHCMTRTEPEYCSLRWNFSSKLQGIELTPSTPEIRNACNFILCDASEKYTDIITRAPKRAGKTELTTAYTSKQDFHQSILVANGTIARTPTEHQHGIALNPPCGGPLGPRFTGDWRICIGRKRVDLR
eukprot:gb/GECG01012828.1/.p1 GENE.gb/GECG01012828.1/~~gb/GECG01012828.1/.p1  ORF type:complete len:145 (+),score=7.27 gb/GECG01012828.1/:1-435(+)